MTTITELRNIVTNLRVDRDTMREVFRRLLVETNAQLQADNERIVREVPPDGGFKFDDFCDHSYQIVSLNELRFGIGFFIKEERTAISVAIRMHRDDTVIVVSNDNEVELGRVPISNTVDNRSSSLAAIADKIIQIVKDGLMSSKASSRIGFRLDSPNSP